jgi:hypothetical protein
MLIAARGAAFAKIYSSANYGFQVELPPGYIVCGPEGFTADHGFSVLFDTKDCLSDDDASGLYVFASYNAMEVRSTAGEGKLICDGAAIKHSPFWIAG